MEVVKNKGASEGRFGWEWSHQPGRDIRPLWLHKVMICSVCVSARFLKVHEQIRQGALLIFEDFVERLLTQVFLVFFNRNIGNRTCPKSDFQTVALLQIICNPTTSKTAIPVLVKSKSVAEKNVRAQRASGHIKLKISHTVFVTMLSPVQCSAHFFYRHYHKQAADYSSPKLDTARTHTHTLSPLCWENVNQLKNKSTQTLIKPYQITARLAENLWKL